jgi:hypothetical protein
LHRNDGGGMKSLKAVAGAMRPSWGALFEPFSGGEPGLFSLKPKSRHVPCHVLCTHFVLSFW